MKEIIFEVTIKSEKGKENKVIKDMLEYLDKNDGSLIKVQTFSVPSAGKIQGTFGSVLGSISSNV